MSRPQQPSAHYSQIQQQRPNQMQYVQAQQRAQYAAQEYNHHHQHRAQQQRPNAMQYVQPQHAANNNQRRPKKTTSSRRMLQTRVFASGYNYNYQFGVESNDNYSSEMIELEWCRGLNISYICSGLTHLIYLSFTGNYYFCGQIDTEKLGMVNHDKNDNNPNTKKKKTKIITKSVAAPMDIFVDNDNILKVSRIADGVSSRHIVVISRDFKAYSMGSNQRGQLGLGHFKSTLYFKRILFEIESEDAAFDVIDASGGESHSAFVAMPKSSIPIKRILTYYQYKYHIRAQIVIEWIGKYTTSFCNRLFFVVNFKIYDLV